MKALLWDDHHRHGAARQHRRAPPRGLDRLRCATAIHDPTGEVNPDCSMFCRISSHDICGLETVVLEGKWGATHVSFRLNALQTPANLQWRHLADQRPCTAHGDAPLPVPPRHRQLRLPQPQRQLVRGPQSPTRRRMSADAVRLEQMATNDLHVSCCTGSSMLCNCIERTTSGSPQRPEWNPAEATPVDCGFQRCSCTGWRDIFLPICMKAIPEPAESCFWSRHTHVGMRQGGRPALRTSAVLATRLLATNIDSCWPASFAAVDDGCAASTVV